MQATKVLDRSVPSDAQVRPRIVAVVAPKGGVGKTTLTMSLLVAARKAGLSVLGVNMDPQTTLDKWVARRRDQIGQNPAMGILDIQVVRIPTDEWRKVASIVGYDVVIVDTPPSHSEAVHAIRSLCDLADLVLVPTQPYGPDLDEVIPFSLSIGKDKAVVVLNRVNRRTRSFLKAKTAVLEWQVALCPVEVPHLEAIPNKYMFGLSVSDFGDDGSESLEGVWHYVRKAAHIKGRT